jgi:hypothetical protein
MVFAHEYAGDGPGVQERDDGPLVRSREEAVLQGATFAPGAARLLAGPTYATRRQLPAWASGAHCSWKVEANRSSH